MFESLTDLFRKAPQKGGPVRAEPYSGGAPVRPPPAERKPTYSKVFRRRLADGQTEAPATVEVLGSFNHWQKVPLTRDSALDAWHVTIHHIQAHIIHHYMLLVDGKPVYDKNCDGLAVPHGPEEEKYQLVTPKGPRVLMLFAQAK